MAASTVLGVDIGTSSSKGVLVDLTGRVLRSTVREHTVSRPHPGWVEMDGRTWWDEFVSIARELVGDGGGGGDEQVVAVGVSGMGPCVLLVDEQDQPVRPAILYGVDTRASEQIARLEGELGADEVLRRCGSALTSQAAGAKIAWVADEEPEAFARARRFYMPASWLAHQLTGSYVLDHHSASQCTPIYDVDALDWYEPWATPITRHLELPELRWTGEPAGQVTTEASRETGLPPGIPVISGTVDAWSEAVSVGAHGVGDLMLMYGTTMFLINTVQGKPRHPSLWGTVGALPGTRNLAGGMATSGAVTGWLRDLSGSTDFAALTTLADAAGPGANGLLMLPYFAGERTPILDPDARGTLIGLTLSHGPGDLYRAALEATAFGVRHNIEVLDEVGGDVRRIVAVGGGTQGTLWTQIVSDVIQRPQVIPSQTIGASYGAAFLAAQTCGEHDITDWNPPSEVREPQPELAGLYDERYALYRDLYERTKDIAHALAASQVR